MHAADTLAIRHVYAWLLMYPDGNECPLSTMYTDKAEAQQARAAAQDVADSLGASVVLAHFAMRETLQTLAPARRRNQRG